MDIQAVICKGRARTVADTVEALEAAREQKTFEEAKAVDAVERLAALCVEMGECLRDWQRDAWKDLFSGELLEVQHVGTTLREVYAKTLGLFDVAAGHVAEYEGLDYDIKGATEFRECQKKLKALAADFEKRWPLFNLAELDQARQRIEKGDALSAEEFRRALLGHD